MTAIPKMAVGLPLVLALVAPPSPASAQQDCKMLFCSPQLTLVPSVVVSNLFDAPRVRLVQERTVEELEAESHFALVFDLSFPTAVPRTGAGVQLFWTPFADGPGNPFTGYTAQDVGEEGVDANWPTIELYVQLDVLRRKDTNGWLGIGFDVADQFEPAAEPAAVRSYVHKLDFELDLSLGLFSWLAEDNWLRHVTAYATLDYLATGLPEAGDEVPRGERVYLDDASPWSLWTGLSIPLAPIVPR